jgi:hypothetical protein
MEMNKWTKIKVFRLCECLFPSIYFLDSKRYFVIIKTEWACIMIGMYVCICTTMTYNTVNDVMTFIFIILDKKIKKSKSGTCWNSYLFAR